jgi:UDP-N-acetylmuramate dehydrogenase
MNWQKNSLKKLTSFKIGGKISRFIEPKDEAELREILYFCRRHKLKALLIGAGSNILASERAIKDAVMRLSSAYFSRVKVSNNEIECGAGSPLGKLLNAAKNHGLSGAEFLAGIPGTVGGALIMNAGAWGASIGDLVKDIRVMDYAGKISHISRKKAGFIYRNSNLGGFIILSARFRLIRRNKAAVTAKIKKYLENRAKSQDNSLPNAGCVFKNPALCSAGMLIDACGLKGKMSGGAVISGKHANFILNAGRARAADVLRLMRLAQGKVKKRFGVDLEPEIRLWK